MASYKIQQRIYLLIKFIRCCCLKRYFFSFIGLIKICDKIKCAN